MSQTLNSPSCTSASRRAGPTSLHSGPDSPGSENAPTASPHAGVEEPWDKSLKEDLHLGPSTGSSVAQVLSGHSSPTSAQSSRSRFNSSSDSWERVSVASNPSDRYYEVDSDPEKRRMSDAEGPSENGGSGATGATGKGGKPRWYRW